MTERAWVSKATGVLRPFIEGEDPEGYSEVTHDLIDMPAELIAGTHVWDADTRTCVPAPPIVPQTVTPLQIRRAIRHAGLKPSVGGFIAGLDPDGEELEAWNFATQVDRDNPLIAMAIVGLGWTEQQADELFILAATL